MARFAQIRRTTVFQELNYSIISFCKWTLRDESVKWLASTELICFHWNGFSSGSMCAERITYWIKAQQPQEKSCFFKRDAATTNKSCTQCCNGYPFRETTVYVFQRNLIAMGCKVIGIFFFSSTGNYTVFSIKFLFWSFTAVISKWPCHFLCRIKSDKKREMTQNSDYAYNICGRAA